MSQDKNTIECPNCGFNIDVNEILYHQLDEELKKKYNDQLAKEKRNFNAREDQLRTERENLEKEKSGIEEKVAHMIQLGIRDEKKVLEKSIKQQVEDEQADRIKAMQSELNDKSEKVKELNKSKSEIERLKREKEELRDTIELESQKRLSLQLAEEREKIRKAEEAKATMKLSEQELMITQLKDQLQEAHRKAQQGSMQIQGEAQELVIEDWLSSRFPLDTIEEIKKGAQGADCLQIVNTRTRQNCGSIYYESKRTKAFQPAWIEKFKADIRDRNANIGVLVSEVMPSDMDRMGLKDGIWICTFEEFKGLCTVLRESIIELSRAITTQENKGEKMGMLYDFLTSNEFRLQIEAIVEGFTQMQTDLESEKRSMQGIWKKREKQIQKVLLNTNHMYHSIRGIAGSAIQAVPLLELDREEDDEFDE
ncbi:MAG TPA: DUF2130 domain-containing protein [Gammaproteobacteria bacterium]|nr:DUF2130 domain-containing protein [Gammaproteobacteria bacterium]